MKRKLLLRHAFCWLCCSLNRKKISCKSVSISVVGLMSEPGSGYDNFESNNHHNINKEDHDCIKVSILPTCLHAVFMRADLKSAKRKSSHHCLFELLGSLRVKATHKMLVKMTKRCWRNLCFLRHLHFHLKILPQQSPTLPRSCWFRQTLWTMKSQEVTIHLELLPEKVAVVAIR